MFFFINEEKKSKLSQLYYKVLLVKMGYKYSFFLFFPLMLLIWDCTQSQNFKNFSNESWKICFCRKITNGPDFSSPLLCFHNLTFNFTSMLPKVRVVDPWIFFVNRRAVKLNFHEKNQNHQIFLSLLYIYTLNLDLEPSMLPKQEVLNP